MSFYRDLAPGQNPHVNYEPSVHGGLRESPRMPNNPPEIHGRLTQGVIERRNDYVQARGRYNTMMDWERDDLVKNIGDALRQCERDVQERMLWHLFMIHDDYGARVAQAINLKVDEIRNLTPLPTQVLTEEDKRRQQNLGRNGDRIDPKVWGQWTSSVTNHQATADEVLKSTLPTARRVSNEEKATRKASQQAR
jgi:catalase